MMRFLAAVIFALPWIVQADGIVAENAYIPVAPPMVHSHSAYMSLHNNGDKVRSLIGVAAQEYGMAHLHQSQVIDGIASMSPVAQLDIPARGSVALAPGGLHVMMMMPKVAVQAGEVVLLTLTFADGELMTVSALVEDRNAGS
ncbi:copper chaperone PCu(A)C [Puniceibacterium sediminis]|uniref:Copper(I)-binding protein n=1 Tax=Puniceibacterium sediminis TaxID=1608407 RepID=A0A238ZI23_9RHOB|nr:copper chaperone PCu(A)C [Puniceibacterium sediminis]SNR82997.1 hypothetical protein SAMN06265370_13212 [Puniceibacterium sediminis]